MWPSDRELLERFITAPLYQYLTRGRLAMVLEGVEQELRTNKAESTEVPAGLQIEHVMPQAWHENWPLAEDIDDKQDATENRNRLIHTIGNLTLVNGRLNPALSNARWGDKRKALAEHSVLYLNKSLVNEGPEHWDEVVIEERSKRLHKRAIRIWPHADDLLLK
ncbi:MAG: HNH endonuclease [Gammaproteobacteria bacterium]|nr:HNH endonuclease [Gammaproteobacteria bacterium]